MSDDESNICKICCYVYNRTGNVPRVLIWGHTFCSTCISKNKNGSRPLKWPVCKKLDARPISQIPKNHEFIDLIEENTKRKKQPRSREGKNSDEICRIHNMKITFYCENEMNYYCSECIEEHQSHDFCYLNKDTLGSKLDQKFDRRCIDLQQRLEHCENHLSAITAAKTQVETNQNIVSAKIGQLRESIMGVLENANRVLNDMVQLSLTQLSEEFEQVNQEAQRIRQVLKQKTKVAKMRNFDKVKNLQGIEFLGRDEFHDISISNIDFAVDVRDLVNKLRQDFSLFENITSRHAYYFEPLSNKLREFDVDTGQTRQIQTQIMFPRGSRICNTQFGLYLIGGRDRGIKCSVAQLFPDGTYVEKAEMSEPRTSHWAIYANGSIFAIGGENEQKVLRTWERYNLLLNKWKPIGELKTARSWATGTNFKQEIYIFGGKTTGSKYLNNIEVLNLATLNWKEVRVKLPVPVIGTVAINRGNSEIILVGGFDGKNECNQMSVFTRSNQRLLVYQCGNSIDSLESPVVLGTTAYIFNSSGQIREIDISN